MITQEMIEKGAKALQNNILCRAMGIREVEARKIAEIVLEAQEKK